jgi:hypothetical protein
MKKIYTIVTLPLLVLLLGGAPTPARAIELTWDIPNGVAQFGVFLEQTADTLLEYEGYSKEWFLDPAAWYASFADLQTDTQSMVNFIASDFNGGPGFVTDLNETLLGVGDASAENFIESLRSEGRIESPFSNSTITEALDTYYRTTGSGVYGRTNTYTLDETCENDEAFAGGDFMACGFSGLRSALLNPLANTPEGSRISITDALFQQTGSAQETRQTEIGWASGLLSWRGSCGNETTATTGGGASTETTGGTTTSTDVSLSSADSTFGCPILTSGSVVFEELVNKIGIGAEKSADADEISELLGSAFMEFVSGEIFGEGGIAGQGASSGGSRPTGEGAPVTPSATTAFSNMLGSMRERLAQYQASWQRINAQAEHAKTNLEQCGGAPAQTALANEVLPLLSRADTILENTAGVLLALADIQTQVDNATTFVQFEEATKKHSLLLSGKSPYENLTIPGASDFLEATVEGQDTGGAKNPPPAFERMKELSDSCVVSS